MNESELKQILDILINLPTETEWVEFKEASNNYDFNKLGSYFSALSNEANLKNQKCGWLIFGVKDKPRKIVGTKYRENQVDLNNLKHEVAKHTSNRITFEDIHELTTPQGRVVMFQIPPAINSVPTSWKGHFYGRDGESLGALNLQEIEWIRSQGIQEDWSAKTCEHASFDDLDGSALLFARNQFKQKSPDLSNEIDDWDDPTFLNKAKVTISGEITNAALLLLGKPEVASFLSPSIAQITWILKDQNNIEQDYAHFGLPFILTVDQLFDKIRNLTIRELPSGTLFPKEIKQYDPWVIRETLHNCIAHQDYKQASRINVVEEPSMLTFTNVGQFLPGSVEEMIKSNAPPEKYRNPFLSHAMVNLNMIDTIGSGIRRMFNLQRERFFPLPDYQLNDKNKVIVRIFGKVLDEKYTNLLIKKSDLDLSTVIALDKVQKQQPLEEEEFKKLKSQKLIEGRRPNIFVSAKIAAITGDKATYIKHRAFDKEHYKNLVKSYLQQFDEAKRSDLDTLLLDKISETRTTKQKKDFVTNLLQEMKNEGIICVNGTTRWATWSLSK